MFKRELTLVFSRWQKQHKKANSETRLMVCLLVAVLIFLNEAVIAEQILWRGMCYTFTKSNYADPCDANSQDRMTDNVWLTRGDANGLFNIKVEGRYDDTTRVSPVDTEWAFGSAVDWQQMDFKPWIEWHNWNPGSVVGKQAVLHLISDDIYLDIMFISWSQGGVGGGFSYVRAVPEATVWEGLDVTFTKGNYVDWTDPVNQDRITDNVWLTRQDLKGIFNIKVEAEFDYVNRYAPQDTEWAYGSTKDWKYLDFKLWDDWHGYPITRMLGKNAVLHLISDDIYLDIMFTDWTVGDGGGFSYIRAEPEPQCTSYPVMDLNRDCKVDFEDFDLLASEWLECNLESTQACGN